MSSLPPGLEDFGERLRDAAEVAVEEDRKHRRARRIRSLALPVAAALATAAVAAGAVKLADVGKGPAIEPEEGSGQRAPKDRTVVAASATDDPDGGPPWVVRVFTNGAGRECAQVGRLRDGDFGQVQGGQFRALPASAPATCAAAGARGPLIAVQHDGLTGRTIAFGVGVDPAAVEVRYAGHVQRVRPVGFGAFLAVFAGASGNDEVVVRARADGRAVVQRL